MALSITQTRLCKYTQSLCAEHARNYVRVMPVIAWQRMTGNNMVQSFDLFIYSQSMQIIIVTRYIITNLWSAYWTQSFHSCYADRNACCHFLCESHLTNLCCIHGQVDSLKSNLLEKLEDCLLNFQNKPTHVYMRNIRTNKQLTFYFGWIWHHFSLCCLCYYLGGAVNHLTLFTPYESCLFVALSLESFLPTSILLNHLRLSYVFYLRLQLVIFRRPSVLIS